ncbi:MAG: c-type cytochrome [Terriglobales bacterium]
MTMLNERKELLIWIAAALITAALMVAVFIQLRHAPSVVRRAPYIVGEPQKGAALFFGDKQCSICHSINGSGGRVAPDLSGRHPDTPAMGWLAAVLWNHGPGMWRQIRQKNDPYPQLNPQEMADILAFLYQASSIDRAGDASAGQRVFNGKGCVRCHSVGGTGGQGAPELSKIAARSNSNAWTLTMFNHAGSMVAPITSTLGQWPQFTGNEMNDLIAYVRLSAPQPSTNTREISGNAELGWGVFQSRCMPCHSVRGQGGSVGPELGPERDLPLTTGQFASVLWNHAPAMLRQARENGISPPVLQGNDMADLRTFLASLRYFEPTGSPLVGERVFSDRGCAACHGRTAEGTQTGPGLRSGTEAYTTITFAAALWRHGPRMIDRAQELGIPWPTLKATDLGDLVSFLNTPVPPK